MPKRAIATTISNNAKVSRQRLDESFFKQPCADLAKNLLGKIFVRVLNDGTKLSARIVETEAYPGGKAPQSSLLRSPFSCSYELTY